MSRRALRFPAVLGLLAVAVMVAATEGEPRAVVDPGGRLVISRLPALLTDPMVKRHLDSGLTTSLVFQGGPQGATKSGAARIDVRLELWDEVYLVTLIDGEGRIQRSRRASAEDLSEWWAELEIVLVPEGGAESRAASQARVSLSVVPFSQAELVDTQRWLAESIGQARGGRGGRRARGGDPDAVAVLIATSMQRRAVRTLAWSVPIERRARP
jgi:hypothetical protein